MASEPVTPADRRLSYQAVAATGEPLAPPRLRRAPGAAAAATGRDTQNAMSLTLVMARMIPIMMTPRKPPINRMATGSMRVRTCFIRRVLFSS